MAPVQGVPGVESLSQLHVFLNSANEIFQLVILLGVNGHRALERAMHEPQFFSLDMQPAATNLPQKKSAVAAVKAVSALATLQVERLAMDDAAERIGVSPEKNARGR